MTLVLFTPDPPTLIDEKALIISIMRLIQGLCSIDLHTAFPPTAVFNMLQGIRLTLTHDVFQPFTFSRACQTARGLGEYVVDTGRRRITNFTVTVNNEAIAKGDLNLHEAGQGE